ncbi:4Fe-4S dicluster domain-containing protein [Clostridia bacterium OttesenSCG-928-F22]|nr:4Fe-4S dicluster domain-containing protein [Clostridia bacterium OttesenSCG-928-F22]
MKQSVKEQVELLLEVSGVDYKKCMKCGKCSASCPSYQDMEYHPHQFVTMIERGRIDELMQSNATYKCLSCFACAERCPRGVDPSKLIEAVRVVYMREKGNNHITADMIPGLLDEDMPQQAITSVFRKYKK